MKKEETLQVKLLRKLSSLQQAIISLGIDHTGSRHDRILSDRISRLYQLVVGNVADLILVIDLNNPDFFAYISPSVTELLGYSINEALSSRVNDIFTAASFSVSQRALTDEIAHLHNGSPKTARSRILELELLHKNGSVIPVEVKFTYLHGLDGKLAEVLAVARDISERKTAEQEVKRGTDRLLKAMEDTMQALARVVEMRDPYTAGHQKRVTELACAIAVNMGLSHDSITGLRLAGLIHDIGKIHVPAEILTTPNALSEAEYAIIRTHPELGYEILKPIDLPWPVAEIVHQHHERIDGSGYPQMLKNGNLLLESKILAVADVVEAIASHRPYRPALGIDYALDEISKNSHRLYDSQVVDCCLVLFREQAFAFQ